MVGPVILVAAALGTSFLLPLFEAIGRRIAVALAFVVLAAFLAVSVSWVLFGGADGAEIVSQTAGFSAPLSINLAVGLQEAIILVVINVVAILGLGAMVARGEHSWHGKQIVLFFVFLLGSFGLVMTRDLFNVFVFMEISGIAVFGLLSTSRDGRAFEAGFKYMVASGLASIFFLIGIAFVYQKSGSLNIADINASAALFLDGTGSLALVFLLAGILVELKPAPANGWALDVYQAADPGLGALISAINATAMVVVLSRILPLFGAPFVYVLTIAGAAAFVVPQVQALRQESFKRMLGYSSVAQIGLVVLALVVGPEPVAIAGLLVPAAFVLLLNHALAKAGLFWIAAAFGDDRTGSPASLRSNPVALVAVGVLVLALLGLPPFPGFWAKWNLVVAFGANRSYALMAIVLGGSLLEVVYLMRWFVGTARGVTDEGTTLGEEIPEDFAVKRIASVEKGSTVLSGSLASAVVSALALSGAGLAAVASSGVGLPIALVLGALGAFAVLDLLKVPARFQAILSAAGVAYYGFRVVPTLDAIPRIFALIFAAGAVVQLIALTARSDRRTGLVALTSGMVAALLALTWVASPLALFVAWELMTLTSFLLVLRGARASAAGLRYIVFSLASAFLMLAAFSVSGLQLFAGGMSGFGSGVSVGANVLLALAILIKLGSVGVHIWLPASYAEAEDEVSSLLSAVLSKAGIFLLFAAAMAFAVPVARGVSLNSLLGWIGAATAIAGAMMALFQEDIKYTLAYSSMSQIGYIVLGFAAMTHLGWVSGLYLAVTHLLFKSMLFLAIAGVVSRTGTRLMYQMGGLIKKMPFTFVSVLIGIIALSGVPPLSGFGGKWLLYSALLERGWYLQAGLALFSSAIAFLYLFRLIHSIFLGQRKAIHDEVREASVFYLIPQFICIIAIMAISMYPNLLIVPLQNAIEPLLAGTVRWDGYAVITSLGYWNGNAVMYVTMGVFLVPLAWLMLVKGRVYRVEQFNIVFAAERPHTPESTHYAYNFFGHYKKAFGSLVDPWVERFWSGAVSATDTVSHGLRSWNTGNPQTYAFQIVLYLLLIVLIAGGGF